MGDTDAPGIAPEKGFQFPAVIEVTAMGATEAGLARRVPEILAGLGLAVLAGSERVRMSRAGNYESVSVSFPCPSREVYDRAQEALRADPAIRWTL